MGIYIKGMEMPTSCGFCPMRYNSDLGDACFLDTPYIEIATEYQKRPDNCPLIPVSPHGRLIDADELDMHGLVKQAGTDYIENNHDDYFKGVKDGLHKAAKLLSIAPTIIPASEEGEA